jgi:hypothetical protein
MPTTETLFPYGQSDGNCQGCGAVISADEQAKHLAWHQALYTATGVG